MPPRKPVKATQREKFEQAACELGCGESEEAFDRALRKIAKRDRGKGDTSDEPGSRSGTKHGE